MYGLDFLLVEDNLAYVSVKLNAIIYWNQLMGACNISQELKVEN